MGTAVRKKPAKHYVITIRVRSENGTKPDVRALGGDTIFCCMDDGQTATWTVKRDVKRK